MEARRILREIEAEAEKQDKLIERLVAEAREFGAAIAEVESLERFHTEVQLSRTSLIFEAACLVAEQEGRKTRLDVFQLMRGEFA